MIRPGRIYMADFGSAGPHPVIVISREELNRGKYFLAVVCTSARFAIRSRLPNCVSFRAGDFGLTVDCVAQCENVLSIEKTQIDFGIGSVGVLDDAAMREITKAIGYVIESDCIRI